MSAKLPLRPQLVMGHLIFPAAKINLGLYVTRKRPDGFHDLETLFYPVPFCHDVLEFSPSQTSSFHLHGADFLLQGQNNLVQKAVSLTQKYSGNKWSWRIDLLKGIPSGAGLGGGSSDAAAALEFINASLDVPLDQSVLQKMALELGSDVPFFLKGEPAFARSRGEELTSVPEFLKGLYLLLVFPQVQISTAEAFSWVEPKAAPKDWHLSLMDYFSLATKEKSAPKTREDLVAMLRLGLNAFEAPVRQKFKEVDHVLHQLAALNPLFYGLSGSGSTCYGIFSQELRWTGPEKSLSGWT